ncbi:MAG: aminotransferase class III-fold pyridoxal phosphate-dependent enzyme [Bacteroidota bacterium]|nr:aminotransferase class III-fold pyridoxal phosphate-dependent enzyme [Bacteroidota bacterium]
MNLFDVYPIINIEPVKGEGCFVFDAEGTKYLDLYGGHAVISIGHSHPYYVKKISDQLSKLGFYSNSVIISLQNELAEKLGRISGYPDYSLFLSNSGAEANENAIKLASFHNGKSRIISFKGAFHGRTAGAVAVTDNPNICAPINPRDHVTFLPLNDLEAVETELKKKDACAVIIEGIQGVAGIVSPSDEFLKGLSELCAKYDTVLILDEVQSGYGRTGKFFAHQYAGIKPDIITTAKGMGNGFPIAGTLISPKFTAKHGMLGTTFGGNHLACAAAIAVLDIIDKDHLVQNAEEVGNYLIERLSKVAGIGQIKGRGLMIGIEFPFPVGELRSMLIKEEKVFTGAASAKNVLRLLPPLSLSKSEVDMFVGKLQTCLSKLQVNSL